MAASIIEDLTPKLLWIAAALATPALTLLAYRGWIKALRKDLPRWRNALGLTSLLITFMGWLGFIFILVVARLIHLSTHFFDMRGGAASAVIATIGAVLALALKGTPRPQAFMAAFLLVLYWTMSFVAV